MSEFNVEAVASEAGVSRATIYRHFTGGREQMVNEAVAFEVTRFVDGLGLDEDGDLTLGDRLVQVLMRGRGEIAGHEVLGHLLVREPEEVMARLESVQPIFQDVMAAALARHLRREELRPDIDPGRAADHLARMVMSYVTSPGMWDLGDEAQVRTLVDAELLGAVLA
jgi:AcrR family transcriptional regulator